MLAINKLLCLKLHPLKVLLAMPNASSPTKSLRRIAAPVVLAALGVLMAHQVNAQVVGKTSATASSPTPAASPAAKVVVTKPEWKDLATAAQLALKPLQPSWQAMSPAQKRKWIELSKNYAALAPADQGKLHARMTDWSSLSPQQRAQARLNFAENRAMTDGLTSEQRKVQWQAYQLLSPEEKRKLAASSQAPVKGAAIVAKPAQPIRQNPPPEYGSAKALAAIRASGNPGRKIAIAPQLQTGNSIMPQAAASDASIPINKP